MKSDNGWVLVTGGAGYVGSVLTSRLLEQGRAVRALDSLLHGPVPSLLGSWEDERFEFVKGDVRDADVRAAALSGVSAVVHLAAIVGDPACARAEDVAREVNHGATLALVDDAAKAGVSRFIFASTCSNYGRMEDPTAYATEDWDLRPVSLYAETKVAAELGILERATPEFSATCLRFATVYGVSPRMRFDLTVNEFTRDALLADELLVYGEQFWRPYVHVRDAASAIAQVMDADPAVASGEVFNVGNSAENYRKLDIVELLQARLPEAHVRLVQRQEDPRDYRVSFEKFAERVGFTTAWSVPEGIDELLALLRAGLIADPFASAYRN